MKFLRAEGFSIIFIHGDQNQAERIRIMNKLKIKKVNIAVSTDLLSRGIDIETINLVINFDVPPTIETYYHRIGRTGRYGRYGVSVLLLEDAQQEFLEKNKQKLQIIRVLEPSSIESINERFKQFKLSESNYFQQNNLVGKKEIIYGKDSQVSKWQQLQNKNFDESRFKYYKEFNENQSEDEEIVSQYIYQYEQKQRKTQEQLHSTDDHDQWGFLKCKVCFEFLKSQERHLNRKFEILQYFQIEENFSF